jgi:hypothetical protein
MKKKRWKDAERDASSSLSFPIRDPCPLYLLSIKNFFSLCLPAG